MERIIRTEISKVYITALDTYEESAVGAVLCPLLDGMLADNGIEKGTLAGKNVVLKPNLLAKREADAGITTHPSFMIAAAKYFLSLGAAVIIADSPGGVYNKASLEGIYKTTGMKYAAEVSGASLNFDTSSERVLRKELSKNAFPLIKPLIDADLIVNLNRLKTHALCQMSASVKNLYGSIPGLAKAEYHALFPTRDGFADMLCDLCLVNAPQINITDGVLGMEGNGPAGGTLRKVGCVIASANPFAADIAASYIMGYKPDEVGTVKCAVKRGLCPKDVNGLTIVGESPDKFACSFKRPDASAGGLVGQLPTIFGGKLRKWMEPRPTVDKHKCVGCGECARNCPVSTIRIIDKKANIDPSACIKCYCCHEFCPAKAIKVKSRLIFKHK